MPLLTSGAGKARYMIHAADSDTPALAAALTALVADPDVELLDTIGPNGQPHTAVVEISHDKALALQQDFRLRNQHLTIEPDRPLSLFEFHHAGQSE